MLRRPRPPVLLAAFLLAMAPIAAPPLGAQAPAATSASLGMQDEVLRLLSGPGWRGAEWGVLAVSLENGDTLAAFGHDRPLAPASNQKLFTTAAALHHLGPDFRFPTWLLTDGTVRDGVLHGNLILYGTGDPALSDRFGEAATEPFRAFAQALRERGIHTVSGAVIGDGSFFEGPKRHASWNPNDLDDWFAAPVSALSFNENVVTLRIRGAVPGAAPEIRTQPAGAGLPIRNAARTVGGAPRSPFLLVRDDPDAPLELRGELRVGGPEVWRTLTVPDPAAFAASALRTVLEEEGIRVEGEARSLAPDEPSVLANPGPIAPAFAASRNDRPRVETLAVHRSPPVRELVQVLNKVSHNLYGELLLFSVGRITEGTGSFESGARALTRFLVERVGVPADALRVEDGSGLSRENRATPDAFVRLMTHVAGTEMAEPFWASLPEAGNRRELGRMYNSTAAGNLRAKTGTIHRVSALSGVVRAVGGEPILFSIVANNVPSTSAAKGIEDRIGIALASFARTDLPAASVQVAEVAFGAFGPRLLPRSEGEVGEPDSESAARR